MSVSRKERGRPDAGKELSDSSDRALIRACQQGDAAAWEALILRYESLIYSVPRRCGFSKDAAEEVFQEVVVRLFEGVGRLRRAESLPSWLVVTTRRVCQEARKKTAKRSSLDPDCREIPSVDPPDIAQRLDRLRQEHALSVAFRRLDEPCRRLLSALYLENPTPSYREIADRLDRPIGSLGPTRLRCLKKLQRIFVELGGKEP